MNKFLVLTILFLLNTIVIAQKSNLQHIQAGDFNKFPPSASAQNDNFSKEEGSSPEEQNMFIFAYSKMHQSGSNNSRNERRLQRTAEIGYFFGIGEYKIDYLKFNAIAGYKINPYFSIGIGSGLRYAMDVKDALIPFFIDFRANLSEKKIPLYLAFDAGYALDVTNDFKSEGFYLLINPSAGALFKISDKTNLSIGLGYDFQKFKMNYIGYDVTPGTTINTTGISINAGISF